MKRKNKKIFIVLLATIVVILFVGFFGKKYARSDTKIATNLDNYKTSTNVEKLSDESSTSRGIPNVKYLSDLNYITDNNWSYNGWSGHQIQKDKNQEGGALGLIVDGEKHTYVKGLSVHAKGQVTFDISEYSDRLTRFIAIMGVDASRGNAGSIWFQIYASNDGETWESLLRTNTLTGTSEEVEVDLDVTEYKYLRIYVDPAGNNSSDHGTIAKAKLVTEDYVETEIFYDKINKLEYYDEILSKHDAEYNYNNNFRLILERELVNKLGYWNIQTEVEIDPTSKELLDMIKLNNYMKEIHFYIQIGLKNIM